MTRARKQLSKRTDIERAQLRNLVLDFRTLQNSRLAEEDLLQLDLEKEVSISEDLPTVSAL